MYVLQKLVFGLKSSIRIHNLVLTLNLSRIWITDGGAMSSFEYGEFIVTCLDESGTPTK